MKIALLIIGTCAASVAHGLFPATLNCRAPPGIYKTGIDGNPCPEFCRRCDHSNTGGSGTTCATTYDANGCITDRFCKSPGSDGKPMLDM